VRGFSVIVDIRLKPGAREAFRRLIDANARASATHEPGCSRFDVLEPSGEADRIMLYEVYSDRAAFDAHVRSEHFLRFDKESAALMASKSVLECDLVYEGAG
jgi:(4S)-4-hydroxy-5-phosphonooxypentane-2,3-dione isomerase